MWAFAQVCFATKVRSIDAVKITGSLKLKKIFSMEYPLIDDDYKRENELRKQVATLIKETGKR